MLCTTSAVASNGSLTNASVWLRCLMLLMLQCGCVSALLVSMLNLVCCGRRVAWGLVIADSVTAMHTK